MVTRVLFLDDDDDLREAFADVLSIVYGAGCTCLGSYAELINLGDRALAHELAVLDINLGPGPTGVDAYEWLRENNFRGRVLFLTGHAADHPSVARALHVGGVEVAEKPIPMARLGALLEGRA